MLPTLLVLLVGALTIFLGAKPASAAVPSGFEDRLVASIESPTALAFTPDGRMLVTDKVGQLWVYKDGVLLPAPALDISGKTCSNSERGLLGVAVDPAFGNSSDYVYLYYTYKKSGSCPVQDPGNPVNRVSRFTMSGDSLISTSERVLIDNIPSPNGNHNGGDLHFGKDGYLYASVGDGGCDYAETSKCQYENDASRDRHILLGKVLRIERDGGIPPDNPYTGSGSDRCNVTGRTNPGNNCQETFARGFRNPFRMAFDPDAAGTSFYVNDVGGGVWEEIDRGRAGADYGWNVREGHCAAGSATNCGAPPAGITNPIHDYNHNTGCRSITGGAFVPDGAWPASFDRAYLFGDYVCGKIFKLTPKDGGGFRRSEFATGLGPGGPIAITFGPYKTTGKALYYTTFAGGGEVRRIVYTAGNQTPVADLKTVGDNYGPLTMNFDASESKDPDGDTPLTYLWDFDGDRTIDKTTAELEASHTYTSAGKYTATLTVRDSLGKESAPDTVEVFPGDTPPQPVIESPDAGTLFRVGQVFTARGSVTDSEDDADGDSGTAPTLRWKVLRHHDGNHTHPWDSGTGSELTFMAPAPEGLLSTNPMGNYLEIRLTATDSQGLSNTVVRELRPKTVRVRFETRPTHFKLRVNGRVFRAPRAFVSWEGYALNVSARRQRDQDGRLWVFRSWSDGRARDHTIITPADPTTYTATFRRPRR